MAKPAYISRGPNRNRPRLPRGTRPGSAFYRWHAEHAGKRKFASRRQAWRFIVRLWIRDRRIDSLEPYECRWAPLWDQGRTAAPHLHVGHGKHTPGGRLTRHLRQHVVWPYFRARLRVRRALGFAAPAQPRGPRSGLGQLMSSHTGARS